VSERACDRCFERATIPTHQMVKFDERPQFLCQPCWEEFRRWFHWGSSHRDPSRQLELF
jgi:hypothetical protein